MGVCVCLLVRWDNRSETWFKTFCILIGSWTLVIDESLRLRSQQKIKWPIATHHRLTWSSVDDAMSDRRGFNRRRRLPHTQSHRHTSALNHTRLCSSLHHTEAETYAGCATHSTHSWTICKSAPRSRQITMPAPHHSVFYRPDALPAAQPTASKHWRHIIHTYTQ